MQTPSHLLITAFLARRVSSNRAVPLQRTALLVGSFLPDIPFALLSLGYGAYYRWWATPLIPPGEIMLYLHLEKFFIDPIWLIGHNFFHALPINSLLLLIGYLAWRHQRRWGRPLFWLAVGTLFHTILDILTHHNDGPLLFFPLNWTYRFASPVSYWDPDHFGTLFSIGEIFLNSLLLLFFIQLWFKNRRKAQSAITPKSN